MDIYTVISLIAVAFFGFLVSYPLFYKKYTVVCEGLAKVTVILETIQEKINNLFDETQEVLVCLSKILKKLESGTLTDTDVQELKKELEDVYKILLHFKIVINGILVLVGKLKLHEDTE